MAVGRRAAALYLLPGFLGNYLRSLTPGPSPSMNTMPAGKNGFNLYTVLAPSDTLKSWRPQGRVRALHCRFFSVALSVFAAGSFRGGSRLSRIHDFCGAGRRAARD
jgi:hypothetical protein